MLHAAAVAGQPGVDRAIALLLGELERNMALLGVNTLGEIGPQCLIKVGGV